jgi:hypothetical protein
VSASTSVVLFSRTGERNFDNLGFLI